MKAVVHGLEEKKSPILEKVVVGEAQMVAVTISLKIIDMALLLMQSYLRW